MRMRIPLVVVLALFVAVSCDQQPVGPTSDSVAAEATPLFDANPVVERVSAGGNDACAAFGLPNGCDGNFSLHVNLRADGSLTGQYQDTFAGGGNGIHATLDCVNIDGNAAVVGGVVTHGTQGGLDATGQRLLAAVVDNGTSANDPPDQISFSIVAGATPDCTALSQAQFNLFNLTTGQVTVK